MATIAGITVEILRISPAELTGVREVEILDSGNPDIACLGMNPYRLSLQCLVRPYGSYTTRDLVVNALNSAIRTAQANKTTVAVSGVAAWVDGNYYADISWNEISEPASAECTIELTRVSY